MQRRVDLVVGPSTASIGKFSLGMYLGSKLGLVVIRLNRKLDKTIQVIILVKVKFYKIGSKFS